MALHFPSMIQKDNKSMETSIHQDKTLPSEGGSYQSASNEGKKLLAGQTISGEIVAVREGEVDIALSKDVILTAKLERDMQLYVGQTMTFEVKSNQNSQISLRPLFENLAQNPNVLNAIKASHIPLNNKSTDMVSSLMEQGMPIDKQSLQNAYKQLVANPGVNPATLAQMNRLRIPVTPETIQQFENYKNYEHSIKNGVETVADEVIKMIGEILDSGSRQEVGALFQKLVGIFTESSLQTNLQGNMQEGVRVVVGEDGTVVMLPEKLTEEASQLLQTGQNGQPLTEEQLLGMPKNAESAQEPKALQTSQVQQASQETQAPQEPQILQQAEHQGKETAAKEAIGKAKNDMLVQESIKEMLQLVNDKGAPIQQTEAQVIDPKEQKAVDDVVKKITEFLTKFAEGSEIKESLAKVGQELLGKLSPEDTLKLVNQLLFKGGFDDKQLLKELLGSKEMSQILKTQITKQWMLEPQQVGQDGKVEELYERIQKQTTKLSQTIMEMAKDNTPLAKSVSNLSNNVDFLNQLNQTFTYVQLPLKMNQENAHGDLYVYTNKKNLAKKDGNVSALLHLDMEHLGTMDIYVAMQQNKVSTKFYLEKEEYLDFVEKHLPNLNEKLEKRGYSMNSEVHLSEKKVNAIEEILEQDKNTSLLSKFSFDVRA